MIPEETQTGEQIAAGETSSEENTERTTMMDVIKNKLLIMLTMPLWVVLAAAGGVIALMLLIICLSFPGGGETAMAIPEGKTAIAVQSNVALTDQAVAGDIVRLYDAEGHAITELQYVEVLGKNSAGELLLLMNEAQTTAFVSRHGGAVSLVMRQNPEKAAELLDLQQRIIDPEITLTMEKKLAAAPGESLVLELGVAVDPVDAILPDVVWASSNPEVATVEAGTVVVHQVGQTTITASCGAFSASCELTARVPLQSIGLNCTEAELDIDGTLSLKANPKPSDATDFAVTWEVDDPAVASVAEDGTVTALSAGTAIVTATCGDVSASCTILIGVHAELVQLSQHTLEMPVGQTAGLTYNVYPADSIIDTPVFTSSDEAIVTVAQDGTVTAVGTGSATITITCGEVTDSCVVTVTG